MKLEGHDIVCIGTADWATELPINQHQLMRRLALRNRVLFVESLGLRRPQLASRDLRRIGRRLVRGLRGAHRAGSLHVLSPLVLPFHGRAALRSVNRRLLRFQIRWAVRRLGMDRPIVWAYAPQAEALLDLLDPELVVYHCVDDVAAQKGVDAEGFRVAEERFAKRADLVLASAPALAERMRVLSGHVLYAPNVADTPERYRSYIQSSRGEFSCAKPSYVVFQSAWVSDRTLCYLASGKPAVVQHTGPSSFLPSGEGMFRFSTVEEAAEALTAVDADYERHCRAAREIAETFFDASGVLSELLNTVAR